jgi:ribonuclease P/MRP protein subunit RPP1
MRIDIISLDLAHRVPFYLKMPLIKEAIARGVFFEITYAPCLRDTGFFLKMYERIYILSSMRTHE